MKLYITPVQLANYIRAFFWALLAFAFFSCGARKVEKQKESTETKTETKETIKKDLSINDNTKTITTITVNDTTKEEIEETVYLPIDNNKPIVIDNQTLNNTSLTKRKIKRNKALNSEINTNTSNDIKVLDKGTKQAETTQQNKTDKVQKQSEREQFNPLSLWWLWILLILLAIAWKYKNKLLL